MKIDKVAGSFNEYKLTLSYGELVALENSLSSGRSGPIADELFAGIKWYLDDDSKLPKPGQEKEDVKKGEKEEEESELPLPSPDEEMGGPEGEEGGPEGLPSPDEEMGGPGEEGPGGPGELPSPEEAGAGEDLDKMVPPPEA